MKLMYTNREGGKWLPYSYAGNVIAFCTNVEATGVAPVLDNGDVVHSLGLQDSESMRLYWRWDEFNGVTRRGGKDVARPRTKCDGTKFDEDKRDYTLLPWIALEEVVKVLEFGARKYERDNWKRVPNGKVRYIRAALRHLVAHIRGERLDSESGLSHLAHCVCCLLFVLSMQSKVPMLCLRKGGEGTEYKGSQPASEPPTTPSL